MPGKGTMRDVIQTILASEAEARQIVAAAHAEAERIMTAARQSAQAFREQVSIETRGDVERLLAESARQAVAEQQARVAQAVDEIAAQVPLEPAWRPGAVAEVVRCVSSPARPSQEPSS